MNSNNVNPKIELLKTIQKLVDEYLDTDEPDFISVLLALDSVKTTTYESRLQSIEAKLDMIMMDNMNNLIGSLDEKTIKDFDKQMYESIENGTSPLTKNQYEWVKNKMGL